MRYNDALLELIGKAGIHLHIWWQAIGFLEKVMICQIYGNGFKFQQEM